MPAPHVPGPQGATPRDEILNTIEEQHDAIRDVVSVLRSTRDLRVLLTHLVELDKMLRPHFAEEERPGGLLDSLSSSAISQHRVIAQIRADHRTLALGAVTAIRDAQECLDGPVAQVFQRAHELCDQILIHEWRESEAALDAIYAESGGSE